MGELVLKSFSVAKVHGKDMGIAVLALGVSSVHQLPLVDIPEILRSFRKEYDVDAKALDPNTAKGATQGTRKELGHITFPIGIIAFGNNGRLGNNIVFSNNGITLSIPVPNKWQKKEGAALWVPQLTAIEFERIGVASYEVQVEQPSRDMILVENFSGVPGERYLDVRKILSAGTPNSESADAVIFTKRRGQYVGALAMRINDRPENDTIMAFHTPESRFSVVIQVEGDDIATLEKRFGAENLAAA